jgi:hypothetical protein
MCGFVDYSWSRHLAGVEMKKMTTFTGFNDIERSAAPSHTTPTRESMRHWIAGLFVSAVLGGIAGLGGFVLGFLMFLGFIAPMTSRYTVATVLIGVSFIFFGLAAHCLDKSDATDKALRLEYCRQHGLKLLFKEEVM